MKGIYILLIIFVYGGCSVREQAYRTITYNAIYPVGSKSEKRSFLIDVPKGGDIIKGTSELTGDYHKEYRIVYPDSSIIYITNDVWKGSSLNFENRVYAGITGYTKVHLLDTLNIAGEQKDEKFWREYILGEIVVGYLNVSKGKKAIYDRALSTLRKKK